jgi:predicted nucleic-acid-binding Zn-ribbon protein|tara:strand:- start:302 stop:532 length:231 start_codon:yes stop_codon:yes gene_type:complete
MQDDKDISYNGWSNRETWNIALWIQNNEYYYATAKKCGDYETFKRVVSDEETLDGVRWDDALVNIEEINTEVINEL